VIGINDSWSKETAEKYLKAEVPPVKFGNKNKTGECGMCGVKVKRLYPHKVGQVDFMICERCKSIMDM
jgi:hypothetical protein